MKSLPGGGDHDRIPIDRQKQARCAVATELVRAGAGWRGLVRVGTSSSREMRLGCRRGKRRRRSSRGRINDFDPNVDLDFEEEKIVKMRFPLSRVLVYVVSTYITCMSVVTSTSGFKAPVDRCQVSG